MASILIAFGIDAVWEQHKESLEEAEVLASLESDFRENLENVNSIIEAYEGFADRVDKLFRLSPEDLLSVRSDPELMGHSKRFHLNAADYISELERMRVLIEEILALIAESR